MTTPAHCTRTDPHAPHVEDRGPWGRKSCAGIRPGVEPPADAAATSDPRLDVVIRLVHEELCLGFDDREDADDDAFAQRILDALDAMRPDEPKLTDWQREVLTTMWAAMPHTIDMCRDAVEDWDAAHVVFSAEAPCTTAEQQLACPWRWAYNEHTGAPAGLSAAQEIRLRLAESLVLPAGWGDHGRTTAALSPLAAWVEHGDDETPTRPDTAERLSIALAALQAATNQVRHLGARADLAEARLGHIADALRDWQGKTLLGTGFEDAVVAALTLPPSMLRVADFATEPDDTAPAGAATGDE